MNGPTIPDEVRRFILTSIATVPHLEALLLLRATRELRWDSDAVAQRLYVKEEVARQVLRELCEAGILAAHGEAGTPHYSYAPQRPDLSALLDRVAEAYAANLVGITGLIHSRLDRQAQQFADAFKWRKDP